MRKTEERLELVTDAKTVLVSVVLRVVQTRMARDSGYLNPLVSQLLSSGESIRKEVVLEKLRMQFLEFCQSQEVRPVHVADPSRSYRGDYDQDQEFEITLDQFKLFAERYVKVDCCDFVEFERKQTESLQETLSVSADVTSLTISPIVDNAGHADSDDGQWDLADVTSQPNSRRQKKLRELKKNIPGKQPKTNMGRLAIRLAWEHEVETGIPASTTDLMRLLRDHALEDHKPEWLGDPSPDVAGEDAVSFFVGGVKKTYRLQSCKRVLREWRLSYHRKADVSSG